MIRHQGQNKIVWISKFQLAHMVSLFIFLLPFTHFKQLFMFLFPCHLIVFLHLYQLQSSSESSFHSSKQINALAVWWICIPLQNLQICHLACRWYLLNRLFALIRIDIFGYTKSLSCTKNRRHLTTASNTFKPAAI